MSIDVILTDPPIEDDENVGENNDEELNPDILEILGTDPSTEKVYGEDLHKDIAPRWQHILLNGLSKENRSELLKNYLPPQNCTSLRAPKINLEIKAALSDINNKKDLYSQSKQNQLSSSLAAVGKALNIALTKNSKIQDIIKPLSDAGRLLCDYHYKESQSRRYAAINTLSKSIRDTVKNTKIDEFLFGSDLSEHLKSSKAISKSGIELRKAPTDNRPKTKPATVTQPFTARRNALNARGAPRAAAAPAGSQVHPAPRRLPAARYQATTEARTHHGERTHRQRFRRR